MSIRYTAGIVNHRSYADLSRCLASLAAQTLPPSVVVVVDHDPHPKALAALERDHPAVVFDSGPNRGFAAGANRTLAISGRLDPRAQFRMVLNADIELGRRFAESLAREMVGRGDVALASGKLLRPDGRTLDSAGISMGRSRKARDRGSEQPDLGQYERIERVFAVSGAAVLIRSAAIRSLRVGGELFDEDFFAYHEDTDLAWRARRLGWSCLYVPDAWAIHRRGWYRGGWRRVDARVRRHSFKNRYLEMIKNERASDFLRDLPAILAWEAVRLGHALLQDRGRMSGYVDAYRLAGRAWAKRRVIQRQIAEAAIQPSPALARGDRIAAAPVAPVERAPSR